MRRALGPAASLALLLTLSPAVARAADVLLVADASSDTNIADALTADGHSVTVVTGDFAAGNAALLGLSPGDYDAVVWVANGSGPGEAHSNAAVFAALTDYVESGGRVFVTGYDSIASPSDPNLVAFIGGTSSSDGASTPGPVSMEENSLTTGVVDIRGVVPSGYYSDRDTVIGLLADTVGVVSSDSNWQWTLRTLGAGEVAYVSNGQSSGASPSWTTTTAGGAGAYNAAVRNFVSGAAVGAPRIRWADGLELRVPEGGHLTIEVTVEDREGDAYSISWDLDGDGEYDDASGESVDLSAEGLDGPTTVNIDVQACDVEDHCSHRRAVVEVYNAPPELGGDPPITTILIGEEWTFTPVITDPGGDEVTTEVIGRPPGSVLLTGGGIRWVPSEDDVGDHLIQILATDDDDDPEVEGDGDAMIEFTLTVTENLPPGQPTIESPGRGDEVAEVRPTLVVTNPTDPEGDAILIHFEVSTADTFTAPIASGGQSPGEDGTTSWTLSEDLEDGGRYYWRAWASDGRSEGPRASSFFFVDLRSGEDGSPGDGGAGDGGVDDGGPDGPVVDPGCACRAAGGATASAAGLTLLFLSVLAVLGSMRRR